mgnify:FL=1
MVSRAIRDRAASIMPDGKVCSRPVEVSRGMQVLPMLKESPSSIVSFLQCPMKWAVTRYGELPRSDKDQNNPWSVLGSFVHRVLEIYSNERRELRTEDLLLETRKACLVEIENGGRSGLVSQREQDAYNEIFDVYEGDDSLPPYWPGSDDPDFEFYRWFRTQSRNLILGLFDVENPEDVVVISTEKWVRNTVNKVIVNMKLDREIQSEGGQLVIDDWKTGKAPGEDEEIEVTNPTFLPAAIYAISDRSREYSNVNRVRLIYLKNAEIIVLKMTDERRELTTEILDMVTKEMNFAKESGEIMATPSASTKVGVCRTCPISKMCPAWSDDTDDPWAELLLYIERNRK